MNPEDEKTQPQQTGEEKKDDVNLSSRSPLIPHPQTDQEPEIEEKQQQEIVPETNSDLPKQPGQNINNDAPTPPAKKSGISLPLVILFLIISFLCGLILAMWFFQRELNNVKAAQQTVEQRAPKEIIVIGTNATDPPMESLNAQGKLVGYDIDLGYRIANEMGVKAEFKNIEWEKLFQELIDKKVDMLMASITITDERKKLYNFSEPYLNAGQVIISKTDAPISQPQSLNGKKIAVQKGTTNEDEAYKYTQKELVLIYPDYSDIGKAVSVGSAEAALSDLTLAKGIIQNHTNLKITSDPLTNEYYGIVMRKDDTELQKRVNAALRVLRVNGYLTDLKQKWLD